MDEAHVEHAVGFIEHQDLDPIETQRMALHEIEQAARSRNQHVDAVLERAHLPADRHAADRERGCDAQVAPVGVEAVEDLSRQLAGGAEHQHAAALALRRASVGAERVQDRQRKGRRLAGAGLGDPDDVAPAHGGRYGLGLDRCGSDVVFLRKGAGDRLCQAEGVKRVQEVNFPFSEIAGRSRAESTQIAGWDIPRVWAVSRNWRRNRPNTVRFRCGFVHAAWRRPLSKSVLRLILI